MSSEAGEDGREVSALVAESASSTDEGSSGCVTSALQTGH